ncbi:MAG: hypothetical protein KAU50_04465 [Candidatus Marinimicrobia bacterium]|nr:hypothetical protein [Candidatus Neomarinimicrobiota bacterium]
MKTSDKIKSVSCNPEGVVCSPGSDADRELLQSAISEVEAMVVCITKLRIFADDVMTQIGGLCIQDFGNLNEAMMSSTKILLGNDIKMKDDNVVI